MYDSPKLRGYTFSHAPDDFRVWWDKVTQKHELSDGSIHQYVKGYLLKFKLSWKSNWITQDDYSNIVAMYNDRSGLDFYPRPNTYSSLHYTIQLTNDFDMTFWNDLLETNDQQGYQGSLEGECLYITATCTTWV